MFFIKMSDPQRFASLHSLRKSTGIVTENKLISKVDSDINKDQHSDEWKEAMYLVD